MPAYNLTIDMTTGALAALGKDGKLYSAEQIAAAERDAKLGDTAALALLAVIDIERDAHGRKRSKAEIQAAVAASMDDCPECRAALARGETPVHDTAAPKRWRSGKYRRRGRPWLR